MSGLLAPFDDGLILQESGQATADAIHSLWLAVNSVLQLPHTYLTILEQWQSALGNREKLRQGATDRVRLAQGFIPLNNGAVVQVNTQLTKVGTPTSTAHVWITIEGDSSGSPNGKPLGTSGLILMSALSAGFLSGVTFTFAAPVNITAGQQYYIVMYGDFTASTTNYVAWEGINQDLYPAGSALAFDGTNWAASAAVLDFLFKLYSQIIVV